MSGRIIGQIYERELDRPAQTVLIALADHVDDDGEGCFPSVRFVAWKTGYTDRQVQRIMGRLRGLGALVPVRSASRHRPNEYRIVVAALPAKPPFLDDHCATNGTPLTACAAARGAARGDISGSPGVTFGDLGVTSEGLGVTSEAPRGDTIASPLDSVGVTFRDVRGDTQMSPEPPFGTEDRNHGDAGASPGIEASAESAALLDAAPASAALSPAEREAAWRERWGPACALFADSLTGNPEGWMGERGKPLALYRNLIGTVGRHVDGDPVKVVTAWRKFESEMRSTVMNDGRPLWSIVSTANVVERIGRWLKEDGGRPRRPLNLDQPNGPMDDILRRLPPRRGPLNLDQPYTEYDEMVRNPHYRRLVQREGS